MFTRIMTPVDLAHRDQLERALQCSADLASHYDVPVVYVGVTTEQPSPVAHTPKEYAAKLDKFVAEQTEKHGIKGEAHAMAAHDPTTDLDDALLKAVDEVGADLVVMASHIPNVFDYIWPSNGGKIAEHAKASVFVVRG
ncbi:universal stress protein [Sediminimonas sp.]|uniref:universal stress protein n=1 Tax=Sediminimonas sp. TaxID=2823379 RepID=UPI0025E4D3ED|nr:universal stress protein [Sediminimonas sp.]